MISVARRTIAQYQCSSLESTSTLGASARGERCAVVIACHPGRLEAARGASPCRPRSPLSWPRRATFAPRPRAALRRTTSTPLTITIRFTANGRNTSQRGQRRAPGTGTARTATAAPPHRGPRAAHARPGDCNRTDACGAVATTARRSPGVEAATAPRATEDFRGKPPCVWTPPLRLPAVPSCASTDRSLSIRSARRTGRAGGLAHAIRNVSSEIAIAPDADGG